MLDAAELVLYALQQGPEEHGDLGEDADAAGGIVFVALDAEGGGAGGGAGDAEAGGEHRVPADGEVFVEGGVAGEDEEVVADAAAVEGEGAVEEGYGGWGVGFFNLAVPVLRPVVGVLLVVERAIFIIFVLGFWLYSAVDVCGGSDAEYDLVDVCGVEVVVAAPGYVVVERDVVGFAGQQRLDELD